MKGWLRAVVVSALVLGGARADAGTCSVDQVQRDVQDSLIGTVEVSNLRLRWSSSSEWNDLVSFEVWSRRDASAIRLAVLRPRWVCPNPVSHEVVVPYDPTATYYVEMHAGDNTVRAVPLWRLR